jgi:hypothetical protein
MECLSYQRETRNSVHLTTTRTTPWLSMALSSGKLVLNHPRYKKQSCPRNRPWRPIGLWDVEDPTLSRRLAHRQMVVRLSALRTGQALLPETFSVLATHLCWRLSEPQGLVQSEGLSKLKKCIYLIRSEIRYLLVCSILAPPPPPSERNVVAVNEWTEWDAK